MNWWHICFCLVQCLVWVSATDDVSQHCEPDWCQVGTDCSVELIAPIKTLETAESVLTKHGMVLERFKPGMNPTHVHRIQNVQFYDGGIYEIFSNDNPISTQCTNLTIYGETSTPVVLGPSEPIKGARYNITLRVENITQPAKQFVLYYNGKMLENCQSPKYNKKSRYISTVTLTCEIKLLEEGNITGVVVPLYEYKTPLRGYIPIKFMMEKTTTAHTTKTTYELIDEKDQISMLNDDSHRVESVVLQTIIAGEGIVIIILLLYFIRKYSQRVHRRI